MPHNRSATKALQHPNLDFLGTQPNQAVKALGEALNAFPGQTDNQVSVDMNSGLFPQKTKVFGQLLEVLPALYPVGDLFIEGLDADFELERAGGNRTISSRNASGSRSGIISKCKKSPANVLKEELKDRSAGSWIQVESSIDELELLDPRSSSFSRCAIKPGRGIWRTGISREERQNSHVNGHPREAST